MTERRISGADEPRAIRVRLATVAFQTCTVKVRVTPFTVTTLVLSEDVMTSMATMKTSAAIATPTKDLVRVRVRVRGRVRIRVRSW